MPRSVEQNREIRQATRAAILSSAMTLFARHGYAHTSIRKIAAEAEISTGLMYHYFESKENLLQAVFDRCMQILSGAFAPALSRTDPIERLDGLLRAIFDTLAADPDFWGLFSMMRTQPAVMDLLGDDLRLWTERLRDRFITDLAALGRPEPDLDGYLLYCLVEGTIQQYLLEPECYPLAAVAARIVDSYTS